MTTRVTTEQFAVLLARVASLEARLAELEGSAPPGYVSVLDRGATPDGDLTPVLQAMLDDGVAAFIPTGTWPMDGRVRLRHGSRIKARPDARIVRRRGATHFLVSAPDAGDKPFRGYAGPGEMCIEGGIWDARLIGKGFTLTHGSGIVIADLTVQDTAGDCHHIEINSSRHVEVSGVSLLGIRDAGGGRAPRDHDEALQLDYAWDGAAPWSGADGTPCEDVTITGLRVAASGTPGSVAPPRGVGAHQATHAITTRHRGVVVRQSTFSGLTGVSGAAVRLYNMADAEVHTCVFDRCPRPLAAVIGTEGAPLENIRFIDNVIVDGGLAGSDFVGIAVNVFNDNANGDRFRNVVISGNSVTGRGHTAIRVSETDGVTLRGNTVSGYVRGVGITGSTGVED